MNSRSLNHEIASLRLGRTSSAIHSGHCVCLIEHRVERRTQIGSRVCVSREHSRDQRLTFGLAQANGLARVRIQLRTFFSVRPCIEVSLHQAMTRVPRPRCRRPGKIVRSD